MAEGEREKKTIRGRIVESCPVFGLWPFDRLPWLLDENAFIILHVAIFSYILPQWAINV